MLATPYCLKRGCKHYKGIIQPGSSELSERPVCVAYPQGIPDRIAYGKDLHLEVRPDQKNGITYEPE